MKKYLVWILSLSVIGLFLIMAIFHTGWYASHDGIFHIYRTEEALEMLKLGEFPLRWAGNFDQGFGIPLFTFIYPLPYYISGIVSYFVGSIWSLKLVIITSYLLGGVGIYQLFSKKDRFIGLGLALIYLMTPYQFLNIFVRGAVGEIMALGLMPWVLVSFSTFWNEKKQSLRWYHPFPLALLLLAHNFLGILFGVFLLGYILTQKNNRLSALSSFILSFGLAAFFILPMVGEKNLLYSFEHQDLTFRYSDHFVSLKQLIYSKWDYWYSVAGDNDGMSFQLGFAQILGSTLGLGYILWNRRKASSLYLVLAYLGSIFLMIARSDFMWRYIPILQTIQFPWRFLFMPAILTPLLLYPWLTSIKRPKLKYLALIALLLVGFFNVRNYRRPMKFFDLTEYTDLYRLYYHKTSTTFRTEILPKWSVPAERYKSEDLLVNAGNMTIDNLTTNQLMLATTINNKPDNSVGRVTILRNYYPGWTAVMDKKTKIKLTPTSEGMISMNPEIGVHTYVIKIGNTILEKIANLISVISFMSLFVVWQKNRHQK